MRSAMFGAPAVSWPACFGAAARVEARAGPLTFRAVRCACHITPAMKLPQRPLFKLASSKLFQRFLSVQSFFSCWLRRA